MLEDHRSGISLGVESRGLVVSIPATLAVVHNDHHRFENHVGRALSIVDRKSLFVTMSQEIAVICGDLWPRLNRYKDRVRKG